MQVRFYENFKKTLIVSLDTPEDPLRSGRDAGDGLVEVGEENDYEPFYIPLEYIKNVPLEDATNREFLEGLRRFNPTLLREVEKVTGLEEELINALRGAKESLDKEIALEERWEKIVFEDRNPNLPTKTL